MTLRGDRALIPVFQQWPMDRVGIFVDFGRVCSFEFLISPCSGRCHGKRHLLWKLRRFTNDDLTFNLLLILIYHINLLKCYLVRSFIFRKAFYKKYYLVLICEVFVICTLVCIYHWGIVLLYFHLGLVLCYIFQIKALDCQINNQYLPCFINDNVIRWSLGHILSSID